MLGTGTLAVGALATESGGGEVGQPGRATLGIELTLGAAGGIRMPVQVDIGATGRARAVLAVTLIAPEIVGGGTTVTEHGGEAFGLAVLLGGADVTGQVVGEITIEGEEGTARLADFALYPLPGTTLYLPGWTGQPVEIWFGTRLASGSLGDATRIYLGVVDLPALDVSSGTIAVRCTDDLQGVIDGLDSDTLATLIGGRWSAAVFDETSKGWAYAQDRLSTVAACLDLDGNRMPRVTPWAAKGRPDIVFDASRVEDQSVAVELAERSSLVNSVEIQFNYRFPRLKADGYEIRHTVVDLTGFAEFVAGGNWFLTRQAVVDALSSCGGAVVGEIVYEALPNSAMPVGTGVWSPGPADGELCLGFAAGIAVNYGQTIDEAHVITVENPASIAAMGPLRQSMSGALEGAYPDLPTWETQTAVYAVAGVQASPPADRVEAALGATTEAVATLTPDTDRDAANAAMECLIDIAKTTILRTHRGNRVSATVPLNPAVDVDKTIEIRALGVLARGKCATFKHRIDVAGGRAVTELSIALCACAGVGIFHPETPTEAPGGADAASRPLSGTPTVAYAAGPNDDHRLTIDIPGVEEGERQPASVEIESRYEAPLVEDLFTITIGG